MFNIEDSINMFIIIKCFVLVVVIISVNLFYVFLSGGNLMIFIVFIKKVLNV